MTWTIRTCRREDLRFVEALYKDLHPDQCLPEEEPLESRMSDLFLVAEETSRIVGFLVGGIAPVDEVDVAMSVDMFPGKKTFLQIQDLYVVPDRRGEGVGTALLQEAHVRGQQRGLECSMVYTAEPYFRQAIPFYEQCGYRVFQVFLRRDLP